jgi:formylglycine-generating enzyme required for sulfatase activity
MGAGGYQDRSLWTAADWDWKTAQSLSHPAFWSPSNGGWHLRIMFDEIPLPLSWPVYVSHAEAAAYARWAGKRLPAEAEWQRAAYGSISGTEPSYPWGSERPGPEHGYFDFERWDPAPVDAFPRGRSAFGLDGLLANGWEWTASVFAPYEGFQPFPFYEGYSANFFDGQHYVMKGGSPRTDRSMLRRSFRNWFQPHYPYVYAGFRCVGGGQK